MTSYISTENNDTSDDNEKVRKPLLNNGSSNLLINSSPPAYVEVMSDAEDEKSEILKKVVVKDSFGIIYFIFVLFGIAVLLPWNIFITAEDVS